MDRNDLAVLLAENLSEEAFASCVLAVPLTPGARRFSYAVGEVDRAGDDGLAEGSQTRFLGGLNVRCAGKVGRMPTPTPLAAPPDPKWRTPAAVGTRDVNPTPIPAATPSVRPTPTPPAKPTVKTKPTSKGVSRRKP